MMRGEHLTTLDVRSWGKNRWTLLDWYGYRTYIRGEPIDIWTPPGYVSDLASIPQPFLWLIPQNGPHRPDAITHDWLFDTQDQHDFSRREVDLIFLESMSTSAPRFYLRKTPSWMRHAMHRAVRIGAGIPWNNNISNSFRDSGLLNPEPGGPRGDFGAKRHEYSGRIEVPPGEQGSTDARGITTPRVP